jgi:hypothetical protein
MIDLVGKTVEVSGWAGPVLWVCTTDGYSIHLYDAPIELDGEEINLGDDIVRSLAGRPILDIVSDSYWFSVRFKSGGVLRVAASDVETARVFKQRDLNSQVIYKAGAIREDHD